MEDKVAPEAGRILIVYEAEAGVWTTYDGERVERADLPENAQVIVFRRYKGGPQ